jgi:hypothetical protein
LKSLRGGEMGGFGKKKNESQNQNGKKRWIKKKLKKSIPILNYSTITPSLEVNPNVLV